MAKNSLFDTESILKQYVNNMSTSNMRENLHPTSTYNSSMDFDSLLDSFNNKDNAELNNTELKDAELEDGEFIGVEGGAGNIGRIFGDENEEKILNKKNMTRNEIDLAKNSGMFEFLKSAASAGLWANPYLGAANSALQWYNLPNSDDAMKGLYKGANWLGSKSYDWLNSEKDSTFGFKNADPNKKIVPAQMHDPKYDNLTNEETNQKIIPAGMHDPRWDKYRK